MAETLLEIEIVTPAGQEYAGQARTITVPGGQSPFQVLINHAPIVSSLVPGMITIRDTEDEELHFAISSGFVEVLKNKVSVIVDKAIKAELIDISRAIADYKQAREQLKAAKDEASVFSAKEKMLFADAEIKAREHINNS